MNTHPVRLWTKYRNLLLLAFAASSGGSIDWKQGGNSFGALGVFGTNDANAVSMRANAVEQARLLQGTGAGTNAFQINGDVADINGNKWVAQTATPAAVNNFAIANAATTGLPTITATGTDATVSMQIRTKSTGTVAVRPGADVAGAFQVINAGSTQTLLSVGTAGGGVFTARGTATFQDANGLTWLQSGSVALAVNNVQITNAATGVGPGISSTGTDVNINLAFTTKGTGTLAFSPGTDSATAFKITQAGGTNIFVVNSTAPGVTITGALTQATGAFSLTGNAASSITTSASTLTITAAASSVWSTSAGNLTVDAFATLNLGTGNATALVLGNTANTAALTLNTQAGVIATTATAIAGGGAIPATLNYIIITINGTARKIPFAAT